MTRQIDKQIQEDLIRITMNLFEDGIVHFNCLYYFYMIRLFVLHPDNGYQLMQSWVEYLHNLETDFDSATKNILDEINNATIDLKNNTKVIDILEKYQSTLTKPSIESGEYFSTLKSIALELIEQITEIDLRQLVCGFTEQVCPTIASDNDDDDSFFPMGKMCENRPLYKKQIIQQTKNGLGLDEIQSLIHQALYLNAYLKTQETLKINTALQKNIIALVSRNLELFLCVLFVFLYMTNDDLNRLIAEKPNISPIEFILNSVKSTIYSFSVNSFNIDVNNIMHGTIQYLNKHKDVIYSDYVRYDPKYLKENMGIDQSSRNENGSENEINKKKETLKFRMDQCHALLKVKKVQTKTIAFYTIVTGQMLSYSDKCDTDTENVIVLTDSFWGEIRDLYKKVIKSEAPDFQQLDDEEKKAAVAKMKRKWNGLKNFFIDNGIKYWRGKDSRGGARTHYRKIGLVKSNHAETDTYSEIYNWMDELKNAFFEKRTKNGKQNKIISWIHFEQSMKYLLKSFAQNNNIISLKKDDIINAFVDSKNSTETYAKKHMNPIWKIVCLYKIHPVGWKFVNINGSSGK